VETPVASSSASPPPPAASANASSTSSSKKPQPNLRTAILLTRSPIITRTPTPFEKAYYGYQQGVARALHNPFAHEFYFAPGAPLETRFNVQEARRDRRSFGRNFGADAPDAFAKPAPGSGKAAEEPDVLAARRTEADEKGDVKSLDRHGQRTLYLVLMKKVGGKDTWVLPTGEVKPKELLHEVSYR
jgi:large subunit ribosomal protein L46